MKPTNPTGIRDLQGREPYGVVLSIGVKGPSGAPVEKDIFHLLEPLPVTVKRTGRGRDRNDLERRHHPRFRSFNEEGRRELRRMVTCQLVHRTRDEAFGHYLKCYRPPGQPVHPQGMPFCVGDGVEAVRYAGPVDGEHRFETIPCPHDRCEFRQAKPLSSGRQGPRMCKPWMRLLFRLVWAPQSNLPPMMALYTSQSWNTTRNALGLFESLERQAGMVLGDRPYSLGGYVFTMQVGEKTNKQTKSRYPVVSFAPAVDPVEFFEGQLSREERLEALPVSPPGLLEHDADRESREYLAHVPGTGVTNE